MYRRRLMKGQVDDVKEWKLLGSIESDGETGARGLCLEVDLTPYKEVFVTATMVESSANRRILAGENKSWFNGRVLAMLNPSVAGIYTLMARIDIIVDVLYPYGGYNTGYGEANQSTQKWYAPMFSPRPETYVYSYDVKYIRFDTGNNGSIPAGETLKVYAR